jgi:hypothetical protein
MHHQKAIICLDGHSSTIANKDRILNNICYVLNMFGIPYEVYEPKKNGFMNFYNDMNQSDVLYILNDSLCYHLCEQKCILLSRSIPWVTSSVKQNCIGRITHEMIETDVTFLASLIYRNRYMRMEHDSFSAFTYLIANDYTPNRLDAIGRNGAASWSWATLSKWDMHFTVALNTQDEGLPKINEVLKDGVDLLRHPDDILIVVNRDICLVKEATGILRAYMDSFNLECCYSHRVDVKFAGLLHFDAIYNKKPSSGIDFFAFRKSSLVLKELMNTDLYLGRVGWDSFWASRIKSRLPFNVCYHYPHESDWQKSRKTEAENNKNVEAIIEADKNIKISAQGTKAWFEKIL